MIQSPHPAPSPFTPRRANARTDRSAATGHTRGYADRAFARFRHSRDPADLDAFVRETARPLLSAARSLVRDEQTAADVVQNTLVAAMQGAHRYDPEHPVMPWILGILSNRAMRIRRLDGRAPDPARMPRERPSPDPSTTAQQQEIVEGVRRVIATLPEPYSRVLTLYVIDGWTPLEIARRLQRARSTVRTQLARGLTRLRTALEAAPWFADVVETVSRPLRHSAR